MRFGPVSSDDLRLREKTVSQFCDYFVPDGPFSLLSSFYLIFGFILLRYAVCMLSTLTNRLFFRASQFALRSSCVDPIPLCGQICDKVKQCGKHTCHRECHTGPCDDRCQEQVDV